MRNTEAIARFVTPYFLRIQFVSGTFDFMIYQTMVQTGWIRIEFREIDRQMFEKC